MASTITNEGSIFLMTVASGETVLSNGVLADKIIFSYIEGLDDNSTPPVDSAMPESELFEFNVSKSSLINDNQIIFSTVLPSYSSSFEFNWVGLFNTEYQKLIAVSYEPVQRKIGTDGENVGNVLTKGFVINVKSANELLSITTPPESWQYDFSGRQHSAEQIQRAVMRDVYGSGTYVSNAGQVTKGASVYKVAPGAAIIDGLSVEIPATDTDIESESAPENYPFYIYATVAQIITTNSVENTVQIEASQTTLNDYTTNNGEKFARVLIATLNDENTITDNREYITDALALARPATTAAPGLVSLSNSTTSESETEAATPKAVKSANDAAAAAQDTANTAVSNAATAQDTANTAVSNAETAQNTANSGVQSAALANTAAANAQSTADGKLSKDARQIIYDDATGVEYLEFNTLPGGHPGAGLYLVDGILIYISPGVASNVTSAVSTVGSYSLAYNLYYYATDSLHRKKSKLDINDGASSDDTSRIRKVEKLI